MSSNTAKTRHGQQRKMRNFICVETVRNGFKLKNPKQHCIYVTPPPPEAIKRKASSPFRTRAYSEGDTNIRRRIIETVGRVEIVKYEPHGTYKHDPYDYSYEKSYLVQPQLVVDEWTSPIMKGRSEWHPFQHYKRSLGGALTYPYSYGHRFYAPDSDDWGLLHHVGLHTDPYWMFTIDGTDVGTYSPEKGLPAFFVRDPGDVVGFIPYPSQISELTEAAMNSMLPRIRQELSGVNSLIELTDFYHLAARADKLVGAANHILQDLNWSKMLKALLTPRSALKAAGSNYLSWKFFLEPFIADVHAVKRGLDSIHKRIMRLLKESETVRLRHYSRSFNEFDAEPPTEYAGTVFHGPDLIRVVVRRWVTNAPSKFHAEIQYTYRYAAFQVEFAQLLGLLDAFGVNLNPATIWRAIPFSFIIDWVIGVGRWLDRLKLRNMEPTLNISRYLWSISRSRRVDCSISRSSANYPPVVSAFAPTASTPLPTLSETSYGRFLTVPDRTSITTGNLDSQEFRLATALALSRGRKRVRSQSRLRLETAVRKHNASKPPANKRS